MIERGPARFARAVLACVLGPLFLGACTDREPSSPTGAPTDPVFSTTVTAPTGACAPWANCGLLDIKVQSSKFDPTGLTVVFTPVPDGVIDDDPATDPLPMPSVEGQRVEQIFLAEVKGNPSTAQAWVPAAVTGTKYIARLLCIPFSAAQSWDVKNGALAPWSVGAGAGTFEGDPTCVEALSASGTSNNWIPATLNHYIDALKQHYQTAFPNTRASFNPMYILTPGPNGQLKANYVDGGGNSAVTAGTRTFVLIPWLGKEPFCNSSCNKLAEGKGRYAPALMADLGSSSITETFFASLAGQGDHPVVLETKGNGKSFFTITRIRAGNLSEPTLLEAAEVDDYRYVIDPETPAPAPDIEAMTGGWTYRNGKLDNRVEIRLIGAGDGQYRIDFTGDPAARRPSQTAVVLSCSAGACLVTSNPGGATVTSQWSAGKGTILISLRTNASVMCFKGTAGTDAAPDVTLYEPVTEDRSEYLSPQYGRCGTKGGGGQTFASPF